MEEWEFEFNKQHPRLAVEEPTMQCPWCGTTLHTEWADNGFGTYSVQVSPYVCECGWVESGCPASECIHEKCFSWNTCQGRAIVQHCGTMFQASDGACFKRDVFEFPAKWFVNFKYSDLIYTPQDIIAKWRIHYKITDAYGKQS